MLGFLTIARFQRFTASINDTLRNVTYQSEDNCKKLESLLRRVEALEHATRIQKRASLVERWVSEPARPEPTGNRLTPKPVDADDYKKEQDDRMIARVLAEPGLELAGWLYTRQDGMEFFRKPQDRTPQSLYLETPVYRRKRNA